MSDVNEKGGKRKKTTHGASERREMCAELQTQLKLRASENAPKTTGSHSESL